MFYFQNSGKSCLSLQSYRYTLSFSVSNLTAMSTGKFLLATKYIFKAYYNIIITPVNQD